MPEIELEHWTRRQIKRNFYLALRLAEGWFFFRIWRARVVHKVYDLWTLENATAGAPTTPVLLAANGTITYRELRDLKAGSTNTLSDRYMIYTKDANEIYQVFIGVRPSTLQVKILYTEGARPNGDLHQIPISAQTDKQGNLTGIQSPYQYPTTESELIIPYELRPQFGLWNPDHEPVNPMFHLVINRLRHTVLDSRKAADKAIIDAITDAKHPLPCHWYEGSFTDIDYPGVEKFGVPASLVKVPPGVNINGGRS